MFWKLVYTHVGRTGHDQLIQHSMMRSLNGSYAITTMFVGFFLDEIPKPFSMQTTITSALRTIIQKWLPKTDMHLDYPALMFIRFT